MGTKTKTGWEVLRASAGTGRWHGFVHIEGVNHDAVEPHNRTFRWTVGAASVENPRYDFSPRDAIGVGVIMKRVIGQNAIPSGIETLDAAIGVGGYPRGRIVELFGPDSAVKREMCFRAIAACAAAGGVAHYLDAEHGFDATTARRHGVDPATVLVSRPDTAAQALDAIEVTARSRVVDLLVVADVAAITPPCEDFHVHARPVGQSRIISQHLRKLAAIVHRSGTTVVFVSDRHSQIDKVFGAPETTPGGNALKFYSSVRIEVRRIGEDGQTRAKVIKNKCASPFTSAEFTLLEAP